MGHAEDDLGPAGLVVVVAEDLLIFVAEIAVDGERLLILPGAGKVLQPFRSGELRLDLREGRQKLARRDAQQGDVLERVIALNIDLLLRPRIELLRLGDSERIDTGRNLGEFVASIGVAEHGGADRIRVRNELYHDAFDRLAARVLDEALGATRERRIDLFGGPSRIPLVARV